MVRWLCLTTLVLLVLSVSACKGDTKTQIVGKWEATFTDKRSGTDTKMVWEFLPDGTFTVKPMNDYIVVDKDKYQVSTDGRTVNFRSAVFEETTCTFNGNTMTGENQRSVIKFKKL